MDFFLHRKCHDFHDNKKRLGDRVSFVPLPVLREPGEKSGTKKIEEYQKVGIF
jgi:hypothetical protein